MNKKLKIALIVIAIIIAIILGIIITLGIFFVNAQSGFMDQKVVEINTADLSNLRSKIASDTTYANDMPITANNIDLDKAPVLKPIFSELTSNAKYRKICIVMVVTEKMPLLQIIQKVAFLLLTEHSGVDLAVFDTEIMKYKLIKSYDASNAENMNFIQQMVIAKHLYEVKIMADKDRDEYKGQVKHLLPKE